MFYSMILSYFTVVVCFLFFFYPFLVGRSGFFFVFFFYLLCSILFYPSMKFLSLSKLYLRHSSLSTLYFLLGLSYQHTWFKYMHNPEYLYLELCHFILTQICIFKCLSYTSSWICYRFLKTHQVQHWASPDSKESACNAGYLGLIPGLGRSPGEGHGNPLQYSCLENPMDRKSWWATVHGVEKSQAWLSDQHIHA